MNERKKDVLADLSDLRKKEARLTQAECVKRYVAKHKIMSFTMTFKTTVDEERELYERVKSLKSRNKHFQAAMRAYFAELDKQTE